MVIMGIINKPTILAIGSHPDDVELGSGGLLPDLLLTIKPKFTLPS